jgi:hypothetical protein
MFFKLFGCKPNEIHLFCQILEANSRATSHNPNGLYLLMFWSCQKDCRVNGAQSKRFLSTHIFYLIFSATFF